jgi:transcription elongation GreA/GreB family factor
MEIIDPYEFARILNHHLRIREKMTNLAPQITTDLDNLNEIELKIHSFLQRLEGLKTQIVQYKKDYQIYNFRYGLGNSHSDFEVTKQKRSDFWELLATAEEDWENINKQLSKLRIRREEMAQQVGHFRRERKETSDFFQYYESRVAIFSIVTLDLMGDSFKFMLVTEAQRRNMEFIDLNIISSESPIGRSCLGKHVNDSLSYMAPNGRTINGTVLKCELPTDQQMVSAFKAQPNNRIHERVNPFYLFDRFGTNTSRYRKGG